MEESRQSKVGAIEFYSGIGGFHLALRRSRVSGRVIRAFDCDQLACAVYDVNHGPGIVRRVDISTLTAEHLRMSDVNLWMMSPPCQPYTILNPSAKGASDARAQSFLRVICEVLPELASQDGQPSYLLIENVAGFETSSTRQRLLSVLKDSGYYVCEFLLTPLQFGIPNSRLRYYLVARQTPFKFHAPDMNSAMPEMIWRHIPNWGLTCSDPCSYNIHEPTSEDFVLEVRQFLDDMQGRYQQSHEDDDVSIPDRVVEKYGRLFDIVLPSSRRTCCFTRGYTHLVERAGSILQMNEELDTAKTFDVFLRRQSAGDVNAIETLRPLCLRYFSPQELLRLFCFDTGKFRGQDGGARPLLWPDGISRKSKYRLIGNSVNVEVVSHLINFLYECR